MSFAASFEIVALDSTGPTFTLASSSNVYLVANRIDLGCKLFAYCEVFAGHLAKSKATPKIIREFRITEPSEDLAVGKELTAEVFSVGDQVDVTGTSKGKGWAGTIKRHNFKRGRKTHGGRSYRRVGSIGSMYPQKIFKGKRMAGQMGDEQVTVKRLKVAIVDVTNNVIGVYGAVPGPKKGIVLIKEAK
jgi:large subunit ribosomal protein L3